MENVVITLREEIKLSAGHSMDISILCKKIQQKVKEAIGNINDRIDVPFLKTRFESDGALKQTINAVIEKGLNNINSSEINSVLNAKGFNYTLADFEITEFDEVSSENMEVKIIFNSKPITVLETFTLTGKQAYLCAEGDISSAMNKKLENLVCLEFSPYKILTYQKINM
jgi:hypothetical protein